MTTPAASIAVPGATLGGLLRLAWPIVLSRATQSVIGFCDALMVAPLGEAPLAAATTGAMNILAFMILPIGTAFIVQSFVAQLRGRGDQGAIARYAWYGLLLAAVSGLVALACIPAITPLVRRFGYAADVEVAMIAYLDIRLLSVAGAVGSEALGNWYGGLGNTRPALVSSTVAMIVNVIGNYLLIEPRFGLPGLGVAGAAWASVAATYAGFITIGAGFWSGLGREKVQALSTLRTTEFLRMLRFGLPNGVNWFLEFAAFVLFINVVVGHLGTTVLAAFNVVMQINSIAFMPAFGVASAGAIMIGEAIGRGAKDDVWPILKLASKVGATWMVSIGLVYLAFPGPLMNLFRPEEASAVELVAVGSMILSLSILWQLFDALNMTFSEALRAAGDTTWPMAARIVLAWLFFTPAAWTAVLYLGGGVGTIIASLVLYIAALTVALVSRFFSGRWRSIDLVGSEPKVV